MQTVFTYNPYDVCQVPGRLPRQARRVNRNYRAWDYYQDELGRTVMMTPLGKIRSSFVQRDIDNSQVKEIEKNWLPSLYRNPVGYYERGWVDTVDCQHSTTAAQRLFSSETLIPITIVSKECAHQLFILLNEKIKKVNVNQMFKACLEGEDPAAHYVSNFLLSRGINYKFTGKKATERCTAVPGSIMGFLVQYGPQTWENALTKLFELHGGQPRSLERTYIHAFLMFTAAHIGERIRWREISKKTAEEIYQRGLTLSKGAGSNARGIVCALEELVRAE